MNKFSALRLIVALAFLSLCVAIPARAQYPGYVTNSDDTGFPSYGAFVSSSIDTVNLTNQNLILHIPLLSRKGRGIDYNAFMMYQSKFWVVDTYQTPIGFTGFYDSYYVWRPNGGQMNLVDTAGGTVSYTEQQYDLAPCPYEDSSPPVVIVRSNWVYATPDGTMHQLPLRKLYGISGLSSCWNYFENDNYVAHTDDGQVKVDITNDTQYDHSGIIITRQDGSQDSVGSTFSYKDTNGNFVSLTNPDTLGRTPLTTSTLPMHYYDSNGTLQSITYATSTLSITTAFPTTSYDAYHFVQQYSGTLGVVTSITLANGLSYTFSYDDPANPGHPNPYGEITKITLPTGGYIKYKWATVPQADPGPEMQNPMFQGYLDSRVIVEKDVSEDGSTEHAWTYGAGGGGMAVTDPLGNQEIHLGGGCNYSGSTTWFYFPPPIDGTVIYKDASGRTIKSVANVYSCDVGPVYSAQPGLNINPDADYTEGFRNTRLIRSTVTLGDTNQVSKSETDYTDCYSYTMFTASWTDCRENPTETREYDYGSGTPGSLIRKTDTSYWHNQSAGSAYLTAHMWNRVYEKDVYDGPTSTLMASTQYNYDSTSIASTSSVPQHDYTNYPYTYTLRGNVTQIKRLLTSSSTWLTTTNYYNDVGNLVQTTDPGGHTYTLSYTDNFTDGTNRNSQAFLTSVTGPTTSGVSHIEGKQYYWNTGLTAAVCGQNAPSPASCVNTYSPSSGSPVADYAKYTYDLLGRPATVTHGDGGTTSFTFTEPSSPSPSDRITVSSSSAIDSSNTLTNSATIDGLGRVIQTQLTSDPAGTDKVDTVYDAVGRVITASNPYRSTGDPTYGITTNVYDGVGRVTQLIPPDGSTSANYAATTYSGNSITVTDQAGKQRRSFTDGLGRLTEVDEPGAPSGATVSNGYAVISGTEQTGGGADGAAHITFSNGPDQIYELPVYPTCTLYDCGGDCIRWSDGSFDGSPTYTAVYDAGTVSVTVNGLTKTTGYNQFTTGAGLATWFASAFNGDGTSVVNASASGSVMYVTSKTHTATAYGVSGTSASTDTSGYISGPSYTATASSSTLTGGAADFADTGTVAVHIGTFSASVSYGSSSTASSIASALASAINGAGGTPVTVTTSGGTMNFTQTTQGSAISFSISSTTGQPSTFPGTSFPAVVSDGFLNANAIAAPMSLITPAVTLYTYDALNNLICVEQHGNTTGTGCSSSSSNDASSAWRVRRFYYDSLGRMTSSHNPESGTISYTYDSDGNILTKYDARGITTTLTYDQLHRVLTKTYSDSTPAYSFTYDLNSVWGNPITNPIGRLVLSTTSAVAGTELFSYDSRGRVVKHWQCVPSVCGYELDYAYNFAGGVTSQSRAGVTITQSFDSAGRVTQLTSNIVDPLHPATLATINSYTPAGAVSQMTYGNGLVETSAFNNRLQPTQLRTHNPTTGTDILNLSYGFTDSAGSNNGNLVTLDSTASQFFMRTYTYDELNRLSTLASPSDATGCTGLSWSYDAWANRVSQNLTSGSCYSSSQTALANNRISGYSYDAAGNMTSDASHTYTYDAENRLTQVDGGSTATYVYNGSGQRIAKTTSSGTVQYLYDEAGNVVTDINPSPTAWSYYIYFNGSLLAEYENSTTYFVHKDHLGSTRVMTKVDGSVYDSMDYLPFGEQIAGSAGSTHKFTGKERDAESSLDNFGARYMSSSLGRFMSADDSKYINPADPQTFNLYSYVANNPINAVDPTGHFMNAMRGGYAPSLHMPTLEGGGGPTSEGGGGSVGGEMDEGFLAALSGNFDDDDDNSASSDITAKTKGPTAQELSTSVPQNVKDEMERSKNDSDKPDLDRGGDDDEGKFHEEGGDWGVNGHDAVVPERWDPGPKSDPNHEARAGIAPYQFAKRGEKLKYQGDWHVHPGGIKGRGFFRPEPSPEDHEGAGDNKGIIHIVLSNLDNKVYFYNEGKKLIGTMGWDKFDPGRKK
jgi:RHS repeat-associated protein